MFVFKMTITPSHLTWFYHFYLYCLVVVNAANKYEILNSSGERVFYAGETTDLMTRLCYGGCQPFHVTIFNSKPLVSIGAKSEKLKKFKEVLKISGLPGVCASVGVSYCYFISFCFI